MVTQIFEQEDLLLHTGRIDVAKFQFTILLDSTKALPSGLTLRTMFRLAGADAGSVDVSPIQEGQAISLQPSAGGTPLAGIGHIQGKIQGLTLLDAHNGTTTWDKAQRVSFNVVGTAKVSIPLQLALTAVGAAGWLIALVLTVLGASSKIDVSFGHVNVAFPLTLATAPASVTVASGKG